MTDPKKLLKLGTSLLAVMVLASACAENKTPTATSAASINTGIIGGEPLTPEQPMSKSVVALATARSGVFCTGVLIAKNLVVTAGHCTGVSMYPSEMFVIFGTDLRGKLEKRRVLGGKVAPQWPLLTPEQEKNWGDIAVLRFEGEAPEGYERARLLGDSAQLKDGMDVVLAGYGLANMSPPEDPEKLMHVIVKMSDAKYSETEVKFEQHQGKGACHGDSGGPAFATINGKLFLIGVTSRSATEAGGGTCLEGSIYTSIPGSIEFLKAAAKHLNSKAFVPNEKLPQPEMDR